LSCEENEMNILHLFGRFTALSQDLIMKLGLCVQLELKVRLLRKALNSLVSFDVLRNWVGGQVIHNFDLFQEGCVHQIARILIIAKGFVNDPFFIAFEIVFRD